MGNVIRLIGDIHGNYPYYKTLLDPNIPSIQVGDYGLGFDEKADDSQIDWMGESVIHKFITGNHDNRTLAQTAPDFLGNWGEYGRGVFYIGGAWSIDYYHRKEGKNWWPNEELSQEEFDACEEQYLKVRPDVVISHDAPVGIPERMGLLNPAFGGSVTTRTGYRLRLMFQQHQPKWWFFGHWHRSGETNWRGTNFKCLAEFETCDFDLGEMKLVQ